MQALRKHISHLADKLTNLDKSQMVVTHIAQNQRYRLVIERSAVRGIDGFKVEANGDDIDAVEKDANTLYQFALKNTEIKEEIKC